MSERNKKQRVAVAMSGGVDSSVTAALLKEQGCDVAGITMRVCHHSDTGTVQPSDHLEDARNVAAYLGIPHHTVDVSAEFRQLVIDEFISEYAKGRTPNPCVRCNQWIKFGLLQEQARALGAEFLATGHYARVVHTAASRYELHKGVDQGKDQSYFLFALTQKQLSMAIFPLGGFTKAEVRRMAASFGLPVKDKGESQEICFIPDNDYVGFLEETGKLAGMGGEIVNNQGKVLGRHQGTYRYTVGQRKGLGIAAAEPLYVLAVDAENRRVVVGNQQELASPGLLATELNWIIPPPAFPLLTACKIRYRHNPVPCEVFQPSGNQAEVRFLTPERSVSPGQAVVFYNNDAVIGGGWIKERL